MRTPGKEETVEKKRAALHSEKQAKKQAKSSSPQAAQKKDRTQLEIEKEKGEKGESRTRLFLLKKKSNQ